MGRSKVLFEHMREKHNVENNYLNHYFFYKKKSKTVKKDDNRLLI